MGYTSGYGNDFLPSRLLRQALLLVRWIFYHPIAFDLLPSPDPGNWGGVVQDSIAFFNRVQRPRLLGSCLHRDFDLRVSFPQLLNLPASRISDRDTDRPLYAYWSFPEPAGAVCINEGPITMVGGLVKIGVDILITTLPIPLIMRMKMQKKQRYMVCLLLGLGYIVCIAGVVRAYYTWKSFYGTNDPVWDQYPAFIAAALENNIAIVSPPILSL